ncbi:MAG TPA: hypothetical protein VKM72_28375 [Thermoanaerobaculia bacterium]|nr:hypothetical protein [Thermoanaerobaculia bacterium]
MKRIHPPLFAALVALAIGLTGCGTLTRLTRPLGQAGETLFTSATLADLTMVGIKTGPVVPVQAAPSDHLTAEIGQGLVGVLLPITRVGETAPWWIFCPAGELQARCEEIPPNARVSFAGQPLGRGPVLLPTRLSWSAQ